MLAFELIARLRKELSLTSSALYETVLAVAERVNRKVHVLRLHARATQHLEYVRTQQRQLGRRVAEQIGGPSMDPAQPARAAAELTPHVVQTASRIKQSRDVLMKLETRIRELKREIAQEELVVIQRDLSLRDAALERIVVARGAAIVGHPIGDVALPASVRLVAAFRGPFLLPLSDQLILRPDDVVLIVGLRSDLDRVLLLFQPQRAAKAASHGRA